MFWDGILHFLENLVLQSEVLKHGLNHHGNVVKALDGRGRVDSVRELYTKRHGQTNPNPNLTLGDFWTLLAQCCC